MQRLPFLIVAFVAGGLVITRALYPKLLYFDQISLILFVVGAVALLITYQPMKRFKMGDVEIEFDLTRLGREIGAAQNALLKKDVVIPSEISERVSKLLQNSVVRPGIVVLALCSMLEEALRNRLGPEVGRFVSLDESLNQGVKLGLLPTETQDAFKTFWKIKGRIVIDKHFRVDSEVLLTLIATATDLLKIISAQPISPNQRKE